MEGTLEAILNVIDTYSSEKCKFQLVDFGVGPPTNMDIEIAKETGGELLGATAISIFRSFEHF